MKAARNPKSAPLRRLLGAAVALGLAASGCVGPALLTDGTSVSYGTVSNGVLRHGSSLPLSGEGYVVPQRWRDRGRNRGTSELVELIVRVARRVAREYPGGILGVADLSPPGGGPTPEHRSHRTGRDVDLIYYATDLAGKPVRPERMVRFDATGVAVTADEQPAQAEAAMAAAEKGEGSLAVAATQRFDVRRNWALVRALLTDPLVPVQWIFIGGPLAERLLDYARRMREPPALVRRAAATMHQPTDAQSHMDHVHVRIFCAPSDRKLGCRDVGPPRWLAKSIKYDDVPERPRLPLLRILERLRLHGHPLPLI